MVVRRTLSLPVPMIHLGETHISVNNPEKMTKTDRTNSPQLTVDDRLHGKW